MRRFIILLTILLPLSAFAQTPNFDSLIAEYSTKEKCTAIKISNAMLRSMEINIDAEYMQVISVENSELLPTFTTQAHEALRGFEVVMSVNRDGKSVEILQNTDNKGSVIEIYIMASSNNECILMRIYGKNLALNNINSLINTI